MIKKINLAEKFSMFDEYWSPKIVAELNGQQIKLARLKGEFVWHQHENEDEMFMVIEGILTIKLPGEDLILNSGEMVVIPAGVEHMPVADEEVCIMMFEPLSTLNTGNLQGDERTHENLEWL
jgi:mannose-6-phosphate isomerase-like protein (cupin superfamily)